MELHKTPLDRAADRSLAHRSLIVVGLTAATITLMILFWYIVDVLLLGFAAVLVAVLLRAPTEVLTRRLSIPAWLALGAVIVGIVALLGVSSWFFGRSVASQMTELVSRLPDLFNAVQDRLAQYDWLLQYLRPRKLFGNESQFVGKGLSVISTTFGVLANIVIVLLMAVFFAAQPRLYVRGLLHLIPLPRRARMEEVLLAIGHILRRWLIGQLVLMAFVAVLTGFGLWFLDVQFALALAILAGLFSFIPYAGPVLGAIPAVLVALSQSPLLAGYVGLLYIGVQIAEAPLEPIVQQRAVYLAPVLVLFAQVVFGILVGPLGVMLATPLTATSVVTLRMLYIEDVLGEERQNTAKNRKGA